METLEKGTKIIGILCKNGENVDDHPFKEITLEEDTEVYHRPEPANTKVGYVKINGEEYEIYSVLYVG